MSAGAGNEPERPVAAAAPLELALEPRHRSGVTGTARLEPRGAQMLVTLTLDDRGPGTHMAHIHTGPCRDEPTMENPRIWANLTDVIDGRSETTVNVVTLEELQGEPASINVHDPEHNQRALVCGDIRAACLRKFRRTCIRPPAVAAAARARAITARRRSG